MAKKKMLDEGDYVMGIMTGGGFGGCTVSLVREEAVEKFIKSVDETYKKRTGLTAEFYVAEVGDGARRVM